MLNTFQQTNFTFLNNYLVGRKKNYKKNIFYLKKKRLLSKRFHFFLIYFFLTIKNIITLYQFIS